MLASGLFLFGAQLTSGINAAILLQTEPIYSIILGYWLLKEKITGRHLLATLAIIIGVSLVIYNGTFQINIGDILVILTPLCYQISHVLAKKTMKRVGVYVTSAAKYLYGGLMFILLSTFFQANQFEILGGDNLIALTVLAFTWVAGILLWYGAIKRINLSKATALLSPYPIVSIIIAWPILGELPTVYQIVGLVFVMAGMLSMRKVKSEKRA